MSESRPSLPLPSDKRRARRSLTEVPGSSSSRRVSEYESGSRHSSRISPSIGNLSTSPIPHTSQTSGSAQRGAREPSTALSSLLDNTEPPSVRRALMRSMTTDTAPDLSPSVYIPADPSARTRRTPESERGETESIKSGSPSLFSSFTNSRHHGRSQVKPGNDTAANIRVISAVAPPPTPDAADGRAGQRLEQQQGSPERPSGQHRAIRSSGLSAKPTTSRTSPSKTKEPRATKTDEVMTRQHIPVRTITNLLGSDFGDSINSTSRGNKDESRVSNSGRGSTGVKKKPSATRSKMSVQRAKSLSPSLNTANTASISPSPARPSRHSPTGQLQAE